MSINFFKEKLIFSDLEADEPSKNLIRADGKEVNP